MSIGVIILAHEASERVGQVARVLAGQGAEVVVHLDRRADCTGWAAQVAPAHLLRTRRAEWGTMGLVDATIDAARLLLQRPEITHICLLSGACLPLRPLSELRAFLAAGVGHDFIDAHSIDSGWIQGGLTEERFTLRHPFAWRRHRWLFDRSVAWQRALGLRRTPMAGLDLRVGSQWWCLSAETLRAILADPDLPRLRRFFRLTWIPDESFFQTMAARHGRIAGGSLTFARFDPQGQPVVLYDDHAEMLSWADHFFARKASPGADALYGRFLGGAGLGHTEFTGQIDDACLDEAWRARTTEHRGLLTPGRCPVGSRADAVDTARPYAVLIADDPVRLDALVRALRVQAEAQGVNTSATAVGQSFAPRPAHSPPARGPAIHGRLFRGPPGPAASSLEPSLAGYRPEQALARLIFAERAQGTVFALVPDQAPRIARHVVGDANARLFLLGEDPERLLTAMRQDPDGGGVRPLHATVVNRRPAVRRPPDPAALWVDLSALMGGQ